MRTKYYLAYGSNLNVRQMAWRCPGATPVGAATLDGWQLAFRGSGTGAYLTIVPREGSTVPVGVWSITEEDELSLDRYEGFPHFYYKQTMRVNLGGKKNVDALVYIMREDRPAGFPDFSYVRTCAIGYNDFNFEIDPLLDAVHRAREEAGA